MLRNVTLWAGAVGAASLTVGVCAQSAYTLVDLGLPPGQTNITVKRLGPDGRAIVYSTPSGGGTRSYLWANGVFQDLGSYDSTLRRNEAADINSSGVITGSSWGSGFPARAWTLAGGVYSAVPTLGGEYANAYSISDNGLITGWAYAPDPASFYAYIFDGTSSVNLGELPGGNHSTGVEINNAGVAACDASSTINRTWSLAAVASVREGMQELGTLGGPRSFVEDINALGHIVGYSDIACNSTVTLDLNPYHAFLWREGVMTDLGRLGGTAVSVAHALNDSGVVVGASRASTDFSAPEVACRWMGGELTDLNALVPSGSGYTLTRAVSINNAGQILARAVQNNQVRAVILTPAR